MTWTSLAERINSLPLILAGPIVRRAEPQHVTVWLALKEARDVTLCIYAQDQAGQLNRQSIGTHTTTRLGDNLHIVAVTAHTPDSAHTLAWGQLYYYDLFFSAAHTTHDADTAESSDHLTTPGIFSTNPTETLQKLVYPGHPLPGFLLPAQDIHNLRIMHGSCRKPHGVGKETLSALDTIIAHASNLSERPQQLFLTGDQIYADDVAAPLLFTLIDASQVLFAGNKVEQLPHLQIPAHQIPPGTRGDAALNTARLTSSKADNHLLSLGEYAAMYIFTWSDVLWPQELPDIEEMSATSSRARPSKHKEKVRDAQAHIEMTTRLQAFRATLPSVRRALANIATYMICDDHDITDDLFLDGAWCKHVLQNPLGYRIVRNGLLAYALFQAWGNTPTQFAGVHGSTLLQAIDAWRGDDSDPQLALIEETIGLPESFDGTGSLQCAKQALRWDYIYAGPHYQLIALDTRTKRYYRAPTDFPGLLSPQALQTQLAAHTRDDVEVTIILSPTPVLGIDFIENIQLWSRWRVKDNYAFDREAWALEWGTFQQLLRTISSMKRVVFLAGDVHYAFGSSLEYWDRHTRETARLVNYTSSPLCNEGSGPQISMLALGYPRLKHLLRHSKEPTLDFFIWDILDQDQHTLNQLLILIRKRLYLFWLSVPRLMATRRAVHEVVLPAWGWLKGAFDVLPPDRSYRIRYLPNNLVRRVREREHRPHANLSRLIIRPLSAALRSIIQLQGRTDSIRRKLQHTTDHVDKKAFPSLRQQTNNIREHAIESTQLIERKLERPRQRLVNALLHSETWLNRWKAGNLIVGYNNIGEISFDWKGNKQEVTQKLWWYNPDKPEQLQSAEYRETLALPRHEDEPALP